jgi:hypothetical protein
MARLKILVISLFVALAVGFSAASTADASPRLLSLYQSPAPGDPFSFVPAGTAVDLYQAVTVAVFSGAHGRIECRGNEGGLFGSVVSNGEAKDTITLGAAGGVLTGEHTFGDGCGPEAFEREAVTMSGFPLTLTMTAKAKVSLTGTAVFAFADGCSYQGKLSATTSFGGQMYVAISGTIKRTRNSPKTCEKSLFVNELGGDFETTQTLTQIHEPIYGFIS